MRLHQDIFTEPDFDPDTLANLGPLRPLAGSWKATKGVDLNPKADGPERDVYIEHVRMDPIDPQTNGPQLFYGLRYHIHINTADEDITFHDQVGYWLWEPATGLVMQTIAIPRGQVVLASGHAKPDDTTFAVAAKRGQTNYGVCSTDFLEANFRTDSYRIVVTIHGEDRWSYAQHSVLRVGGQPNPFDHHDTNTLMRTGKPKPNPLAVIMSRKAEKNPAAGTT